MAADSFNPQEILNRLRGGKSSGTASFSASALSTSGSSIPTSSPAPSSLGIQNPSNVQGVHSSGGVKSPTVSKSIRTPASLTLTATQRQDNLTARTELEKEIKRLRDEIGSLKSENRQLKLDKEDVERQFIEYKIKSEENITKLRGKVAKLALNQRTSGVDGTGKMYPPPVQSANPHRVKPPTIPIESENEGFRDPTFSELMRRSTPINADFKGSLRKPAVNNKGVVHLAVPKTSPSRAPAPSSSAQPNMNTSSQHPQNVRPEPTPQFEHGAVPNVNYYPISNQANLPPNPPINNPSIPAITSTILPFSNNTYDGQSLDYFDNNIPNYRTKRSTSGSGMDELYRVTNADDHLYDTANLPVVEIDLSK